MSGLFVVESVDSVQLSLIGALFCSRQNRYRMNMARIETDTADSAVILLFSGAMMATVLAATDRRRAAARFAIGSVVTAALLFITSFFSFLAQTNGVGGGADVE